LCLFYFLLGPNAVFSKCFSQLFLYLLVATLFTFWDSFFPPSIMHTCVTRCGFLRLSSLQIHSYTFIVCTSGHFNPLIAIDLTSCLLESGAFFYLNMLRNCRKRLRAPSSILLIPLSFSASSLTAFSLSALSFSAFSLSSFSLSGLSPLR